METQTTLIYGDFISYQDQHSKTYQLCFPRESPTPPPYSKVSTTVAASANDVNTQHSTNQRPNAPAMITEEGQPFLPSKNGSLHSRNSRRSKKSYSRSQKSYSHELDSVNSRHSSRSLTPPHLPSRWYPTGTQEGLLDNEPSISPSGHSRRSRSSKEPWLRPA